MKKISFSIPGKPQAQQRHRHTSNGEFVRVYDPSAKDKKVFLLQAKQHAPVVPFDEPMALELDVYFERPKSHYGTGKNSGKVKASAPKYFKTSKPDADNIAKFVMDSLNGVFWKDDSCICYLSIVKCYSEHPSTLIHIETMEDKP